MDKKNDEKNIIIPSGILEEEIFKKKVKYFMWFLELKRIAVDEETETICNGCKVKLKPNQICITHPELEKLLNANKSTITSWLLKLESEGMLQRERTNKYQIITLLV